MQDASCLWLCHRITDTVEFSNPWPGITFWKESFGQTGAGVRSASRTSLFHFLWWHKSKGRLGAWPAFALACSRLGYCCCCLPRKPWILPSIHLCLQTLPKGSPPVLRFAKAAAWTMWYGESVGAEVILAALARDWSCSQSCAEP